MERNGDELLRVTKYRLWPSRRACPATLSHDGPSTLLASFGRIEVMMRNVQLNVRTIGLIASTRVALGIGIGLMIADRLPARRRRALSRTLTALGALTTIPLAVAVFQGPRRIGSLPSLG